MVLSAYLSESGGALDRGLVDLRVLAHLVGRAIAGDAAHNLATADRARVVAVVLDDVVLSQRGVDPAVDCQVGRRGASVLATKVDDPVGSTLAPAETDDEVAGVVPLGVDVAAGLVVLEVGEVAVVVLDVVDGLALGEGLSLLDFGSRDRCGDGGAGQSGEDGRELHGDLMMSVDELEGVQADR